MMKLLFGRVPLGEISNPLFSDQTWYGVLLLAPSIANEAVGRRILAYKDFCEDWNERVDDNRTDASEFDDYRDLTESAEWTIQNEHDGTSYHVGCPVFFRGGDFSCRPWESSHPKK